MNPRTRPKLPSLSLLRALLALACILWFSLPAGCATKRHSDSAGQPVDDPAITAQVKHALLEDLALKTAELRVETSKGVVQLSGYVDSQQAVRRASDVAAGIPGVVSVRNELIVK